MAIVYPHVHSTVLVVLIVLAVGVVVGHKVAKNADTGTSLITKANAR